MSSGERGETEVWRGSLGKIVEVFTWVNKQSEFVLRLKAL
jgi:hypothetical protein